MISRLSSLFCHSQPYYNDSQIEVSSLAVLLLSTLKCKTEGCSFLVRPRITMI